MITPSGVPDGYKLEKGGGVVTLPPLEESIFPLPRFDFDKGKLRWGGSTVVWKKQDLFDLVSFGPPYYNYRRIFDYKISSEVRQELIRFLLCLELWERTPGEKKLSARDIWAQSLMKGPDFADELDDIFALTWRAEDVKSYNFVFPARFLPKWQEHTDDLSLCRLETYADQDVLDEFSLTLDSLLKEIKEKGIKVRLPSDGEILLQRSTTTSYIAKEKRTLPHWEASLLCNVFNEQELFAKRCVVQVFPGGTRDTIIADISANNSIRWIERAMRHILQYVPESAVTLHSSTCNKRIDDVVHTPGYHVLRDIKKCGITYNVRDLFPILKKKIAKYFPDDRWERFNIYQKIIIDDDDTRYEAKRGYGLGMANHSVTLCNIVIHRMCRNAISKRSKSVKGKAIVGNDDCDVVFYPRNKYTFEAANEYLQLEHDIHGRLGNLTNFKKSVVKPFGLFYEQYSKEGWKNKEALLCNAIACAYLAPSIRVAKHYISCQSHRFTSQWARRELRALAAYWGGEFFDFRVELRINFEIGGWLNTGSCGLKSTLLDIEKLAETYDVKLISYAERLCKEYVTPPRPLYSEPGRVTNLLYDGPATKSDNRIQIYTIVEKDLRTFYKKLTKFERNYASRISKYEGRVKFSALTDRVETIMLRLLNREAWYQIPDSLVLYDEFWSDICKMDHTSELAFCVENPTEILLREAMERNTDVEIPDIKWNPNIPVDVMKYTLYCEPVNKITASQFSNSGFLPLLDYWLRKDRIPVCKPIRRMNIYTYSLDRDIFSSEESRFKIERIQKLIEPSVEDNTTHSYIWKDPDRTNEPIESECLYDLEVAENILKDLISTNWIEKPKMSESIDLSGLEEYAFSSDLVSGNLFERAQNALYNFVGDDIPENLEEIEDFCIDFD